MQKKAAHDFQKTQFIDTLRDKQVMDKKLNWHAYQQTALFVQRFANPQQRNAQSVEAVRQVEKLIDTYSTPVMAAKLGKDALEFQSLFVTQVVAIADFEVRYNNAILANPSNCSASDVLNAAENRDRHAEQKERYQVENDKIIEARAYLKPSDFGVALLMDMVIRLKREGLQDDATRLGRKLEINFTDTNAIVNRVMSTQLGHDFLGEFIKDHTPVKLHRRPHA